MANLSSDHQCPDCKCRFVQPFVCTTCGAQKLHDETVRSQAETIERQRAELDRLRMALKDTMRAISSGHKHDCICVYCDGSAWPQVTP